MLRLSRPIQNCVKEITGKPGAYIKTCIYIEAWYLGVQKLSSNTRQMCVVKMILVLYLYCHYSANVPPIYDPQGLVRYSYSAAI